MRNKNPQIFRLQTPFIKNLHFIWRRNPLPLWPGVENRDTYCGFHCDQFKGPMWGTNWEEEESWEGKSWERVEHPSPSVRDNSGITTEYRFKWAFLKPLQTLTFLPATNRNKKLRLSWGSIECGCRLSLMDKPFPPRWGWVEKWPLQRNNPISTPSPICWS